MAETHSEILIYQSPDGKTRVDVTLADETVWLSQAQMAELFQTTKQNISLHVKNVFGENELQESSVVKEYLTTAQDGKRYQTRFYNLDVIISVGYRVRSHRGTQFRIWATQRLREYIVKGFTLDDERLKEGGRRSDYFDELIERVREIRTSEKYARGISAKNPLATKEETHVRAMPDGRLWRPDHDLHRPGDFLHREPLRDRICPTRTNRDRVCV
jgi:hypothetical protein